MKIKNISGTPIELDIKPPVRLEVGKIVVVDDSYKENTHIKNLIATKKVVSV